MDINTIKTELPLHIYKASAGSGKTYLLALEYIKIALTNYPNGFSNILAVTFTNKATAEMKERMIHFLIQLSQNKNPAMADYLADQLKISTQQVMVRAKATIIAILNDYSRFSVTTIDSFFQKVIRSFALELGLQASYKAEIDQKPIISDAIAAMVADINHNPSITKLAGRLTQSWMQEGENWRFADKISAFSTHLERQEFKFYQSDFETLYKKSNEEKISFFEDLDNQILSIQHNYLDTIISYAKNIYRICQNENLTYAHFKGTDHSLLGYVSDIKKLKKTIKDKPLPAVFRPNQQNVFGSNKIEPDICRQILEQLDELERFVISKNTELSIAKLIKNQICLLHASIELQHYIKKEQDDKNIFLISNSALLLSQLLDNNDVPYLYFKTGYRFNHFLLDEFQDTSYLQWQSFGRLIENTLAENHVNMIVGDVKQAIYRWRGGDWNLLLDGVEKQFDNQSQVKNLASNYRSDEFIIGFNNKLFDCLPKLISQSLQELYDQKPEFMNAIDAIQNAFQGQTQIPNRTNGFGLVEIRWFIDAENEDQTQKLSEPQNNNADSGLENESDIDPLVIHRLEALGVLLDQLYKTGYIGADIGILTSTKKEINWITDYFQYAQNYKNKFVFDTQASLKLENATVVRILVCALDWLIEPENNIAKENFHRNYLFYLLPALYPEQNFDPENLQIIEIISQINTLENHIVLSPDYQKNDSIKTLNLALLANLPLIEVAEKIANFLCLYQIQTEQAYLINFLDKILYYTTNFTDRVSDFLAWWHSYARQDAAVVASQTPNSIQLLTIHKSKGLDYKVVIIPFADWEIEPHNYMHWSTAHHKFLIKHADLVPNLAPYLKLLPILPIKHGVKMIDTIFESEYITEKINSRLDALNMLYVACTRARHALYMFCELPKPAKKENDLIKRSFQNKNINQFVYQALQDDLQPAPNTENGWQHVSSSCSFGSLPAVSEAKTTHTDVTITELKISRSQDWQTILAIRARSQQYFAKKFNQAQYLGNLIHDILASTRTIEDIETQILHLEFSGELIAEELELLRAKFQIIIQDTDLMQLLALPCISEREIVIANQASSRPDRIIITGTHILIIDFKTGFPSTKHHKQINAYSYLLKQIYSGYSTEGLLLYIDSEKIIRQKVDLK